MAPPQLARDAPVPVGDKAMQQTRGINRGTSEPSKKVEWDHGLPT